MVKNSDPSEGKSTHESPKSLIGAPRLKRGHNQAEVEKIEEGEKLPMNVGRKRPQNNPERRVLRWA